MAKIMLDRSGELRKGAFYRFAVQFDDDPPEQPGSDWIVAARTPTYDELVLEGKETYLWIQMTSGWNSCVETKNCPADPEHVTHRYMKKMGGERMGGKRLSPIVATDTSDTVFSDDLSRRVKGLAVRGGRLAPIDLTDHHTDAKIKGFWNLQFVGRARLRLPMFVDAENRCPHCGQGIIACKACGYWNPYCSVCKKEVAALKVSHGGKNDKRLLIDEDPWRVIEGKSWDGSDLVQAGSRHFTSKRFIDWLLRIHAAPFYAEPVYFCVDDMSEQQKKWFDDLQKPFEV